MEYTKLVWLLNFEWGIKIIKITWEQIYEYLSTLQ